MPRNVLHHYSEFQSAVVHLAMIHIVQEEYICKDLHLFLDNISVVLLQPTILESSLLKFQFKGVFNFGVIWVFSCLVHNTSPGDVECLYQWPKCRQSDKPLIFIITHNSLTIEQITCYILYHDSLLINNNFVLKYAEPTNQKYWN